MPNGQFSLWESEKLLGFGMCCMTLLCIFLIFFPSEESCSHFNSFPSMYGLQNFPSLFEEKYLYLVPAFITELPQNSN